MRIVLKFEPLPGTLEVPIHYNRLVQGFLYRSLDRALASWLHEQGFQRGKRQFRLFTFSRLLATHRKYQQERRTLQLHGPIVLKVGSVHTEFLESLAVHLIKTREFRLNGTPCQFISVEVETPIRPQGPIQVKTLSPITVYRTLYTREGRRKTYYFTPYEEEFEELLLQNLHRKAEAYLKYQGIAESLPPLERGRIRWIRPRKEVVLRFKGTVIKGWTGLLELDLPEPYFALAYDAGLGAKNSQGFGMVEVVKPQKEDTTGGSHAKTQGVAH